MTNSERTHRSQLATDLRSFADFLDSNPGIPAPRSVDVSLLPRHDGSAKTEAEAIAEVERIAAELGTPVEVHNGHHTATISFGLIRFRAFVVTAQAMARHEALWSYQGVITPDVDEAV